MADKFNIILSYRPFSFGNFTAPDGELHQLEDGSWQNFEGGDVFREDSEYEKHRISIVNNS